MAGAKNRAETRRENLFLQGLATSRRRPWVIAHRGDSAHAPENTLEALAKGHSTGAEACEIDVRLSRDGQPIVIHDDSLLRTTDVALRFEDDPRAARGFLVRDFDFDEIRTLDAGSWFLKGDSIERSANSFGTLSEIPLADRERMESGAIRVPHLRECLELVVAQEWLINVEIKSAAAFERSALDEALAEIARCRSALRVLISSFDHSIVARASASGLGVATGVLTEHSIDQPGRYVRESVQADTLHLNANLVLSEEAVSTWARSLVDLRAHGVPVLAYTVNDQARAERALRAGLDALFADDPRKVTGFIGSDAGVSSPQTA
jgi:glycerophosphoryl diester phosphodiesterase